MLVSWLHSGLRKSGADPFKYWFSGAADFSVRAGWPRIVWALAVAVAGLNVLGKCLHRQPALVSRPINAARDTGWSTWWDQGKYLDAAQAWANGNLDLSHHWYLPGYALLGAPFVRLVLAQPFLIPNLACLTAAIWLFAQLTAQLAPKLAHARALGALIFLGTLIVSPKLMDAWIVPWSTTPTAPLILGCLLVALRFQERPTPRRAFLTALSGAAIAMFRPTDAVALSVVVIPFMIAILLLSPLDRRSRLRVGAAAVGGAVLPLAVLAAAYAAIHGLAADPYLAQASWIGLEWRSLPLQWVEIFVSPRPLFPEGRGLAQGFPWVVFGVAGMAAMLAAARGRERAGHVLVVAVIVSYCAFSLAFRDLHPQGLWRYANHHYFKWMLPVFALYGVFLAAGLLSAQRLRAAAAGLVAVCVLFAWRVEWAPDARGGAVITGPHTLALHHPHHHWSAGDGVLFRAAGAPSWESVYFGSHEIRAGEDAFPVNASLKIAPVDDGMLLTLLRPLPPGEATLTLDPAVTLDPNFVPVAGHQRLVFGLPFWFQGTP